MVGIGLPVLVFGFASLVEYTREYERFEAAKENTVDYIICQRFERDLPAANCIYEPEFDAFIPYKIVMGGSLTFFGALVVVRMSGRKEPPTTPNGSQLTQGAPIK
ncbi:MAG: hypothetical protein AUH37_03395 [Candidatus Nitrososphaera sp. 13_1_40CM_48_12]|nr:MAG: hypothetical protein AUH37_03395 [Candidatus Nitrososphaera sp. 13_1_40CM_48_12]